MCRPSCGAIRPGDVAVDVGANKGSYLRWLSRAAGPGKVVAFEPQPQLAAYLERACRLQVLARATGMPFRKVRSEVVRETRRMIAADAPAYAGAHFAALKRILDREEPDYSR